MEGRVIYKTVKLWVLCFKGLREWQARKNVIYTRLHLGVGMEPLYGRMAVTCLQ